MVKIAEAVDLVLSHKGSRKVEPGRKLSESCAIFSAVCLGRDVRSSEQPSEALRNLAGLFPVSSLLPEFVQDISKAKLSKTGPPQNRHPASIGAGTRPVVPSGFPTFAVCACTH